MQIRFLTDHDQLDAHFPRLVPLFECVVRRAAQGEFDIEDLYRLARQGHVTLGMIGNKGHVQLAIAFEFIAYPRFAAVNILALAGQGVAEAFTLFSTRFKAWCKEAGAQKIQVSCSPAMARLLRRYGFLNIYQTMHCNL